jgi:hypothetical protein
MKMSLKANGVSKRKFARVHKNIISDMGHERENDCPTNEEIPKIE